MDALQKRQGFFIFKSKSLLSILKDNFLKMLFLMFLGWCCYQIHMDGVKHASDNYISFSEAWDGLKSNKFMQIMQNACEDARYSITKANNGS